MNIDEWRSQVQKEPGAYYKYNDVRVNVLAYSLLHVFRESLPKVLQNNIMNQIGASDSWRWYGYKNSWTNIDGHMIQSVSGGGHNGGGVFINSLDHARFGLLYLNNGNWNGIQILDSSYVKEATSVADLLDENGNKNVNYGYQFWLAERQGLSIFYARGLLGQYVICIPEKNMIVVRLGRKFGNYLEDGHHDDFYAFIDAALEMYP